MANRKQHCRLPPKQRAQTAKPHLPLQQPRNPVEHDLGPVSIIRRDDGRLTRFADISALWEHAYSLRSSSPENVNHSVEHFRTTQPWLAFWNEHTIALQMTHADDVPRLLSCPKHNTASPANCLPCTALQSILHLWLWDDPRHPLPTSHPSPAPSLLSLKPLQNLLTLSVPYAMLLPQILHLQHLASIQEVNAIHLAFAPGLALRLSWSFRMPPCHVQGHPAVRAIEEKIQRLAPGTPRDATTTTTTTTTCAPCQRETVEIWTRVRGMGAGENGAAKAKGEIVVGGWSERVCGRYGAGRWMRYGGGGPPAGSEAGIGKDLEIFVASLRERRGGHGCAERDVAASRCEGPLSTRGDGEVGSPGGLVPAPLTNAWRAHRDGLKLGFQSPPVEDQRVSGAQVGTADPRRALEVVESESGSRRTDGDDALSTPSLSSASLATTTDSEGDRADEYQAAHLWPEIDWTGPLETRVLRHGQRDGDTESMFEWYGSEPTVERGRRDSL